MPDGSLSTVLERAEARFTEFAADTYCSGRRAAEDDAHRLSLIALKIVGAVDALQEDFDKLGVSRDVASYAGPVRTFLRSKWSREEIAEAVAEAVADLLLNDSAAGLLVAQVRAEVA